MAFVIGIERRVAYQAVDACFGAQQAVGIIAFELDGGAVDARDFTKVFFQDVDFKAFAFGIAGVHAVQHACPVFRFGAACTCHDVDEAVVAVGFLVEHALEFQIGHAFFQHGDVFLHACKRFQIGFFYGHFQQHAAVVYA